MPNNPALKRLLPFAIVGLIGLGLASAVVGDWMLNMWESSVRIEGRYAKQIATPLAPAQLPKDSYVCNPAEKNPWVGCAIR